jgi:4-amino-4-deoxy-L-arabinose transferase-like glycosyltransferase
MNTAARVIAGVMVVAKLVMHAAFLAPYGYFRDELYYLACADHPAPGYVDHPPLSILLLRGWRAVIGDSVTAIRIVPALAGALVMLLTAKLVLEMGGGAVAVAIACVALLATPGRIATDHYYSMNALDALFWTFAAWILLRVVREPRSARPWLALGAVLGLGVLNKWSVLWLGAGIAVAVLFSPARSALRTPWPYAALLAAVAVVAPHFAWEAEQGWPTLEFMRNALALKYVRLAPGAFVLEFVRMTNPASALVWGPGLLLAFVSPKARSARPLAMVFMVSVAIVAGTRGKPEYLLAAFPLALAASALAWERALARASVGYRATATG